MKNAVTQIKAMGKTAKWAVIGKGPTFAERHRVAWGEYLTIGLNHVCRHMPTHLSHFTDLDALEQCADALEGRCIVLPYYPHVNNRPGNRSLDCLVKGVPILKAAHKHGLLWTYNSSLAKGRKPDFPVIVSRFFSAVVAVNLLAAAKIKTIRTLGIDGGAAYAPDFSTDTLLSNGRPSFDVQFKEIDKTVKRKGIDLQPFFRGRA